MTSTTDTARSEPFSDPGTSGSGSSAYNAYNDTAAAAASSSAPRSSHHHHHQRQQSTSSTTHPKKVLGDVVVELKNIYKSYPIEDSEEGIHVLKDVCISDELEARGHGFASIRQGEFVLLCGPSGAGKTTLLNLIGAIDLPTSGTVKLFGHEITKDSDDDFLSMLRLRNIGFVFQTFNLLSAMSALENVELPMTLLGELSEKERRSRAKKLLSLVGMRNRMHHLPSECSGGEEQRVVISRALANNPGLLILDEPTGDLDCGITIQVMDLIMQVNYMSGVTCIMVTHNPDLECYADRIIYVEDGRFKKQVTNAHPVPLVRDEYEAHLKKMDHLSVMSPAVSPYFTQQQKKRNASYETEEEAVSPGLLVADDDGDSDSGDNGNGNNNNNNNDQQQQQNNKPSSSSKNISSFGTNPLKKNSPSTSTSDSSSNPKIEPVFVRPPPPTATTTSSTSFAIEETTTSSISDNKNNYNENNYNENNTHDSEKKEVPAWRQALAAHFSQPQSSSSAAADQSSNNNNDDNNNNNNKHNDPMKKDQEEEDSFLPPVKNKKKKPSSSSSSEQQQQQEGEEALKKPPPEQDLDHNTSYKNKNNDASSSRMETDDL